MKRERYLCGKKEDFVVAESMHFELDCKRREEEHVKEESADRNEIIHRGCDSSDNTPKRRKR